MSMTLLLWKAPVVRESDEAEELLKPFYNGGDESGFEPSDDLTVVSKKLLERFPDTDDGPWSDWPPYDSNRILMLGIKWGADNAVIDAIEELAKKHELVLYDPQGPDVHLHDDPDEPAGPVEELSTRDVLKMFPMALIAAGIFFLGWWIDVPVLRWVLMIGGAFLFSVVIFLFWVLLFDSKKDAAGS